MVRGIARLYEASRKKVCVAVSIPVRIGRALVE